MRYTKKIIMTKTRVRVIESSVPLDVGYEMQDKREDYSKSQDGSKTKYSYSRAQDNLVLTIDSNVTKYSKFITLTFADAVLDYDQAMIKFKRFAQFFKRKYNQSLKYTKIAERQLKRGIKEGNDGSWHFHLVVYLDQYFPKKDLQLCWPYGILWIDKVDDPKNLGRYMGKYLSKQKSDIALHKQLVSHSRGLAKPSISYVNDKTPFDDWKPIYQTEYNFKQDKDNSLPIQFKLTEYDIT